MDKMDKNKGRLDRISEMVGPKWEWYKDARSHVVRHAAKPKEEKEDHIKRGKQVFAEGFGFYKLFWVFLLCGFLGVIIEFFFVGLTSGQWMSRSSLVIGQFSIVWGFGGMLLTWALHRLIDKDDRYIFISGTILGGAFEYMCSYIGEKLFGCIFWDYSHMRFNINGRVNLTYCFFWGVAALVWIKLIYPWMSKVIERIPILFGKICTYVLLVFMVFDMAVSAAALARMNARDDGAVAHNWAEEYVDEHFTDEWIENRYRNMKLTD